MTEAPSFLKGPSSEHPRESEFSEQRLNFILDEIIATLKRYKSLIYAAPTLKEQRELIAKMLECLHADTKSGLVGKIDNFLLSYHLTPQDSMSFKQVCLSLDQDSGELYERLLNTEEMLKNHLSELQLKDKQMRERNKRADRLLGNDE